MTGRWIPYCSFFVHGKPRPQPRQRHFAKKLASGKIMARSYDPGTAEAWKGAVALAARPFLPKVPLDGPLRVSLAFYMPRPKSHFGTGKNADNLKPSAPIWHTTGGGKNGGDRDNLDKAVLDCLTQIGFWRDDGLVCSGELEKRYAGHGEPSGMRIWVKTWSEK